jgi:hypothetical protein
VQRLGLSSALVVSQTVVSGPLFWLAADWRRVHELPVVVCELITQFARLVQLIGDVISVRVVVRCARMVVSEIGLRTVETIDAEMRYASLPQARG